MNREQILHLKQEQTMSPTCSHLLFLANRLEKQPDIHEALNQGIQGSSTEKSSYFILVSQ